MTHPHTELMIRAAVAASAEIMAVYARDFVAEPKSDGSPVTVADQRAEQVILEQLASTGIPVLGEESVAAGIIPALDGQFFVVDPLDGTREFIKRNGEFTVNIALTDKGRPRSGVVLAPATGAIYWGDADGAFAGRVAGGSVVDIQPIRVAEAGPLRIVASRSHGHAALAALCDTLRVEQDVSVGSSLKFCMLANGEAQLYPRFTPTSEWDTAAGQAVLEAAGGVVWDLEAAPLTCGHRDRGFLNSYFIAAASEALARRALEEMRQLVGAVH
ncbi:MAG: 3'(2'),5'-bisphosphate nucleotidase CysQ [Devosia sp.]